MVIIMVTNITANLLYAYGLYKTKVGRRFNNADCLFFTQALVDLLACVTTLPYELYVDIVTDIGCVIPANWTRQDSITSDRVQFFLLNINSLAICLPQAVALTRLLKCTDGEWRKYAIS